MPGPSVFPSGEPGVSEEAVPGPSVLPSGEPGVSGDFWVSQEACQGPFRPSGRNRVLSRSGGEKGLRGSGAGTLGVPLEGTRPNSAGTLRSESETQRKPEVPAGLAGHSEQQWCPLLASLARQCLPPSFI